MSYIGKTPVIGNFVKLDSITVVNGQAAYTMQNGGVNFTSYDNVNQFLVSLNGVLQAPTDSFTVSGSTLTFASNLSTGDVIDFVLVLGNSLDIGTPSDNTVTNAKLSSGSFSNITGVGTLSNGLTLSDNILFDTASKGIYLGVTSATASNLLDDYEFGTFTPSIAPTSGSFSAVGTLSGFYTKIGNLVHYQCELSVTTNGTASGNIDVTGLPFTSASTGVVHTVNHGRETQIDGSTFVTIQSVNTTALVMQSPPFGNGAGYSLNGVYRV